jgi:maltooligosyltrehalose trehalohydrolase
VLDWYRSLVRLRTVEPDVRGSDVQAIADEEHRTLVMRRGTLAVGTNLGDRAATVPLEGQVILADGSAALVGDGLALAPRTTAVVRLSPASPAPAPDR